MGRAGGTGPFRLTPERKAIAAGKPRHKPRKGEAAAAQAPAPGPATGGRQRTARIVRTEAGARRYGVQVGQAYTEGRVPQQGQRSPQVVAAKQQLAKLGLFTDLGAEGIKGPNADVFGPRMEAGIRSFQRRQGLPVTGKLDVSTQKRLDAAARSSSSSSTTSAAGGAAAAENRQIDRMANRIQRDQRKPAPAAGRGASGRPLTRAAAVDLFHSLPPKMQRRVLARARAILANSRPAAG